MSAAAEEGSFYFATNATTATELTGHTAPAIGEEATKPLLYLYNGSNSRYIIIDQVYIRVETVHDPSYDDPATTTALAVLAAYMPPN